MRKITYHSNFTEDVGLVGPSNDLVEGESATESGARGINLTEMTSDFDKSHSSVILDDSEDEKPQITPQEVMNLLVLMGDEMDRRDEEVLASFSDFLIQKFAEAQKVNYTVLFNSLMIKVNNSDLVNRNEIIKKLSNIYSKTLVLEYIKNNDFEKSKESAYKKVLHRADQYLSEE